MQNVLVVWEYDNPHDNVLSRYHHLLEPGRNLTLIGYSEGKAAATEAEIRTLASDALHRELKTETVIPSSSLALEANILATVASGNFDLLVKSGAPKKSMFSTSIDSNLLRQLRIPQLICANHRRKSGTAILATVDVADNALQGEINRLVLEAAGELSQTAHKELNIAYVIPVKRASYELEIADPMALIRKHGSTAIAKLKQLVASHNLDSAKLHVSAGLPEIELKELAKASKADLVIVGSVGRKGIKGFLLGNTAERVIKNVKRDVLIIKPRQSAGS